MKATATAVLEATLYTGKKITLRELTGGDELACKAMQVVGRHPTTTKCAVSAIPGTSAIA